MTTRVTTLLTCLRARRPAPLALTLALAGCVAPASPSLSVPLRQASLDGAHLFAHFKPGTDFSGSVALTAAQAQGHWHWRFFGPDGGFVRAEFVRPDGAVERELRVTRAGSEVIHTVFNAFGAEVQQTHMPGDGTRWRRWRSGQISIEQCHHIVSRVDLDGRRERWQCLSASGAEMADSAGCSRSEFRYDERGQTVESSCFGPAGPRLDDQGVHRTIFTRDDLGDVVGERYEDTAGRPTVRLSLGCHARHNTIGRSGDVLARTCLDAAGAPVPDSDSGVTTIAYEVDARGCVLVERYLDPRGQPISSRWSEVGQVTFERGPRCEILRQEWHRLDGSLVTGPVAVKIHHVNAEGLTVRTACFDQQRLPTNCLGTGSSGGSVLTFDHDEQGRLAHRRAYASSMAETPTAGGIPHLTAPVYDEEGRVHMIRFYDEYGRPGTLADGIGQEVNTFDERGLLARIEFFNWQRGRIDGNTGCHSLVFGRDGEGRRQRIECLTIALPNTGRVLYESNRWPAGARSVDIVREPRLVNLFRDHDGREVKRIDCAEPGAFCYR